MEVKPYVVESTRRFLRNGDVPDGISDLIFDENFNGFICKYTIPSSVKRITFGNEYNSGLLENVFPEGIEEIYFGDKFNQHLFSSFPNSLRKISFGDNFNQKIEKYVFGKNLESINFGKNFNRCKKEIHLPEGVKIMRNGEDFVIPDEITIRSREREQPTFPRTIILPHMIRHSSPPRFQKKRSPPTFPWMADPFPERHSPPRRAPEEKPPIARLLSVFRWNENSPLPKKERLASFSRILFGKSFNQKIKRDSIPPNITSLVFQQGYNQDLIDLPSHIKSISVPKSYGKKINFPSSLEKFEVYVIVNNQKVAFPCKRFEKWKKEKDFKETLKIMRESERKKILSSLPEESELLNFVVMNIVSRC